MPHSHVALLMCILYFLSEEAKDSITYYLGHRLLDRALHRMVRDKLFPDWFGESFKEYSFSCSALSGLREAFFQAFNYSLVVREQSVSGTKIVLKMDNFFVKNVLSSVNVTEEDAKKWAQILECLLIEERVDYEKVLDWSKFHQIFIEKNPAI